MALELVYGAFRNRTAALDHIMLWAMMQQLGQDLGVNDVIFIVRTLGDRNYVTYKEDKNRITNEVSISKLMITPSGCDIVEKNCEDPAVMIL